MLTNYTDFLENEFDISVLKLLINGPNGASQPTHLEQPAIVALQLSQIYMWKSLGVNPKVVLGHSIGEFAAAVAAKIMQPETALRLAVIRGKLMGECPKGSMAAVFAPVEELQQLPISIAIAAYNSPLLNVLSGPREQLVQFLDVNFRDRYSMLNVSHAFHSPFMDGAATKFRSHVGEVSLNVANDVIFVSSMTGERETYKISTSDYWSEQIINPVKFLKAVETSFALLPHVDTTIEFGSDSVLINMSRRIISDKNIQWIPSSSIFYITKEDEVTSQINEIQNSPRRTPLFNSVPIPWNRPVAIDDSVKIDSEFDIFSFAYDAKWTPIEPNLLLENTISLCLAISTRSINIKMPNNWKGESVVKTKTSTSYSGKQEHL